MSDVTFSGGLVEGSALARGDVVRVTFTERWSIQLDSGFKARFDAIWDNIARCGAYPITANSSVSGSSVAVADCRVSVPQTAAQLVEKLNSLDSYFVRVAEIEKLTTTAAKKAATDEGAHERAQQQQEQEKKQDDSNPLQKFADFIGTTITVVKWLAIAVVAVYLFANWKAIKSAVPRLGGGK